jgi:hypothetical protein
MRTTCQALLAKGSGAHPAPPSRLMGRVCAAALRNRSAALSVRCSLCSTPQNPVGGDAQTVRFDLLLPKRAGAAQRIPLRLEHGQRHQRAVGTPVEDKDSAGIRDCVRSITVVNGDGSRHTTSARR